MGRMRAAAAALALGAGAAGGAERLTAEGAALAPARFAPDAPFAVTVDAGADEVLSVHVLLRPASSSLALARDRDGFWAPWDGDPASLPPAAATREGGLLTFKLFAAPPAGFLEPYVITLAYRTPQGLKLGWFEATAEGAR